MFQSVYADVFKGDEHWQSLDVPEGDRFAWEGSSTYVKHPPYFEGMTRDGPPRDGRSQARACSRCSATASRRTTSRRRARSRPKSPAGQYLVEHGVEQKDFNSYGSRRGNHEVMVRGTFANVRLRNQLAPGTEGGVTRHFPTGDVMSIFDASERYKKDGVPLVVLAGKEYGSGRRATGRRRVRSSSACAPSSPRATSASTARTSSAWASCRCSSRAGESAASLGLTGEETFDIDGLARVVDSAKVGPDDQGEGARRRSFVRRDRAHRYAERVRLLPPRRHPPVRPSAAV